jgi:hypothetical protein
VATDSNVGAGGNWSQTFSYDPFANITKSGSISWMPGYSSSTNRYPSPGGWLRLLNGNNETLGAPPFRVSLRRVGPPSQCFGRLCRFAQAGRKKAGAGPKTQHLRHGLELAT